MGLPTLAWLQMMFPGLAMPAAAGAGAAGGGEWQGVLDGLATTIQGEVNLSAAAAAAPPPATATSGSGSSRLGLGLGRLWDEAKATVGIPLSEQATQAAQAAAASLAGTAAAAKAGAANAAAAASDFAPRTVAAVPSWRLTLNPGELISEAQTVQVALHPKDGEPTLERLIDGIKAALLPLQPHHQARKRLEGSELALTINTYIVGQLAEVPLVCTVDVHRAETLGWVGHVPPTGL